MLWNRRAQRSSWTARRPFREARLRSYIAAQHRLGRALVDVLEDPYVKRHGSDFLCRRVLEDAEMIALLERDVEEAIRKAMGVHA